MNLNSIERVNHKRIQRISLLNHFQLEVLTSSRSFQNSFVAPWHSRLFHSRDFNKTRIPRTVRLPDNTSPPRSNVLLTLLYFYSQLPLNYPQARNWECQKKPGVLNIEMLLCNGTSKGRRGGAGDFILSGTCHGADISRTVEKEKEIRFLSQGESTVTHSKIICDISVTRLCFLGLASMEKKKTR